MKRKVTGEDIFELSLVGDVVQHPTDHIAAVVVTKMNKEDNKYFSHIWQMNTDSGELSWLTTSDKSEATPVWSPDGKWLAFLSNRNSETQQLYLMPQRGGEAIQVTDLDVDVQSIRWHPNGKSIAFIANVKALQTEELAEAEKRNSEKKGTPINPREKYTSDVMVITRTWYRLDGVGYFKDNRNHLFLVNVDEAVSGRYKSLALQGGNTSIKDRFPSARVTEGVFDIDDFAFAPDGKTMVVTTNTEPDADESQETYLYRLAVDLPVSAQSDCIKHKEDLQRLPELPKVAGGPVYSPDNRYIAFYGHDSEYSGYTQTAVWLYDLCANRAVCLTKEMDETFGDLSLTDTRTSHHNRLVWSADGKYVFSLLSHRATTQLVRIDAATGQCDWMTHGDHCVLSYSLNRQTSTVTIVRSVPTDPCNIFTMELPVAAYDKAELRRLTHFNEEFFAGVEILKPEKFTWTAPDGIELDGWALLPTEPAGPKGYPTVVEVHGGPMMMYAENFFFEFQLLAASGMAVIYTNPRGSMGYGQDFCKAIRGTWGQLDFQDLETFVDTAMERYPLDSQRVAIAGGSYGGFMAAWAIGHTKRYKAAVVMRSVTNEYSMFGTCDVGFEDLRDFGTVPWEQPDTYFSVSPIAAAGEMDAHVLLIHSENDLRCPIEQAEQLYMALRVRKVPVEFVRFPNESHGLSRNGQPWHRVFRLEKIQSFLTREFSE